MNYFHNSSLIMQTYWDNVSNTCLRLFFVFNGIQLYSNGPDVIEAVNSRTAPQPGLNESRDEDKCTSGSQRVLKEVLITREGLVIHHQPRHDSYSTTSESHNNVAQETAPHGRPAAAAPDTGVLAPWKHKRRKKQKHQQRRR